MPDPMSAIDKIISEAQKEGKFEDLPGKGQPLVIDPSPDAVVKGILKEANVTVTPEWITLAIEIDRLLEHSERLLEEYAAEYAADRALIVGTVGQERQGLSTPAAAGMGDPPAPAAAAGHVPERCGTAPAPPPAPAESRWQRGWRALAGLFAVKPAPALPAAARYERLAAFDRRWDLTLARYAGLLHECNRKIRRFNQIVPLANRQRAPLPVEEQLEACAGRFPRLARAEDGTLTFARGSVPPALLAAPPEEMEAGTRQRDLLQVAALQRARQFGRRPPPIG